MLLEVSCPLPKSPPESSTAFGGGWRPGCSAHQLPGWLVKGDGACLVNKHMRTPCAHCACLLTIALIPGGLPCSVSPLGACLPLGTLKCSWALGLCLLSVHLHLPSHPTGQVVLAQRPLGNLSKVRSSRRSQTGLWPGSGYALTAAPGRRGGLVSKSCQLGCQLLWVRPHLLLGAQWGQPG